MERLQIAELMGCQSRAGWGCVSLALGQKWARVNAKPQNLGASQGLSRGRRQAVTWPCVLVVIGIVLANKREACFLVL